MPKRQGCWLGNVLQWEGIGAAVAHMLMSDPRPQLCYHNNAPTLTAPGVHNGAAVALPGIVVACMIHGALWSVVRSHNDFWTCSIKLAMYWGAGIAAAGDTTVEHSQRRTNVIDEDILVRLARKDVPEKGIAHDIRAFQMHM